MKYVAAILVLLSLCGCMDTTPEFISESSVLKRWLPFISQGADEQAIVKRLGEPTETFENGRILAYDLIISDELVYSAYQRGIDGYGEIGFHNRRCRELTARDDSLVVIRPGVEYKRPWLIRSRVGEYSLVLVFDDSRTLQSFRLLRMKP